MLSGAFFKTGSVNRNWAGLQYDPYFVYGKGAVYEKGLKGWGVRRRQHVALDRKRWRDLEW